MTLQLADLRRLNARRLLEEIHIQIFQDAAPNPDAS